MPPESEAALASARPLASQPWRVVGLGLGVLALVALPFVSNGYVLSLLTFVAISAVAGLGLQILLGFAGQICLGQAAFVASGAYATVYVENLGLGSIAGFVAAIVVSVALGLLIALPALRLAGLYLGFATMSFGFIVEAVAGRWTAVTGGNAGIMAPPLSLGPYQFSQPWQIYALSWGCLLIAFWLAANLKRGPTGRALAAIRDSEIAARSAGVAVARTKGVAFALNAGFAGLSGALYAHALGFLSPDQFTITMSLEILVMVLIGGLGSLSGVLYGALFVVLAPELLQRLVGLAAAGSELPGLRPLLFGVCLGAVLLLQPLGLAAFVSRLTARR